MSKKKLLHVAQEHVDRAAKFCMEHRHASFSTTETMDDLADEFQRVADEAKEEFEETMAQRESE